MAVTIEEAKRVVAGNKREVIVDITGPASYTTGGETLTAAQLTSLMPEHGDQAAATDVAAFLSERDASGNQVVLDRANGKVLFFDVDSQAANAADLDAVVVRAVVTYDVSNP